MKQPWARPVPRLLDELGSSPAGLSAAEAAARLARHGRNQLGAHRGLAPLRIAARQFESPLVLLLVGAALLSGLLGEIIDAVVILAILLASAATGFARELDAGRALQRLRARLVRRADVVRDGVVVQVPVAELVPGDVIRLAAGTLIGADAVLMEAEDLHVNQAVLTGESFPVLKQVGEVPADAPLIARDNCVLQGTSVTTGAGLAVVVATGRGTVYGGVAERLTLRPPETEFNRGLRQFGNLLMAVMLLLSLTVFAANVLLERPPVESLLFAVALAVGLSPELLPAVLAVNLSRSAHQMAGVGVLVRRLEAIENLGSMDLLCTDKTGTLTEGVVRLDAAMDGDGRPAPAVLEAAALTARHQTGLPNPLDQAILAAAPPPTRADKLGEIPYDFVRKRLSVVVRDRGGIRLITKGAFEPLLAVCARTADGEPLTAARRAALGERFAAWSRQGYRVLGVAARPMSEAPRYRRDDEHDLDFLGFLLFFDPPRPGVRETVADLAGLGVAVKIVTGDNRLVAAHLAEAIGMAAPRVITGDQLDELHDEALWYAAGRTDIFAEVDPNQKERIILALKKTGHVVGYLGDGINDAPALHAADVGISVDQAVDVAKEAADFVLLERGLAVLHRGIMAGRTTFANTLKYVLTTESANLGNMVSMAAASLFLPFLPLLASQILLNNFLSDVPAMALAGDRVDPELIERPRRWDMRFIRRFMIEFGLLSSLFDLLTFALLLAVYHAGAAMFRTAWFVESLLTELVIALVVRTRRPAVRSTPGRGLLLATAGVAALTLAIPYLPAAAAFELEPVPVELMGGLIGITSLYVIAAEALKRFFYRDAGRGGVR